jgi:hypothetical protein
MNFAFYIKRVITTPDSKYQFSPSVIFEELNEIFNLITGVSSFSLVDLKERIKNKYNRLIGANDSFTNILRILNNFETK